MFRYIVFSAFCLMVVFQAHASNPIIVKNNGLSKVKISRKGVTRIGMVKDRISSIYGEEERYILEQEPQLGQVFLKPKDKEPFQITIVSENGKSIDLHLTPANIENKSIMLKVAGISEGIESASDENEFMSKNSNELKFINSNTQKLKVLSIQKIKKLMRALFQRRVPKRFEEGSLKVHAPATLTIQQTKTYMLRRLYAQTSVLKNKTDKPVSLKETEFFRAGVRAVAMSNSVLSPGEVAHVYIVGQL